MQKIWYGLEVKNVQSNSVECNAKTTEHECVGMITISTAVPEWHDNSMTPCSKESKKAERKRKKKEVKNMESTTEQLIILL